MSKHFSLFFKSYEATNASKIIHPTKPTTDFLTINLSKFEFDYDTYTLLEKGLTFVPKPSTINVANYIENQNRLIRDLKIKSFSLDKKVNNNNEPRPKMSRKFLEKSKWEPPTFTINAKTLKTIDHIKITTSQHIDKELHIMNKSMINFKPKNNFNTRVKVRDQNNLTNGEKESLSKLRKNKDIIIKPADKGGATVILDRLSYEAEAERQLSNSKYYKKIDSSLALNNSAKIKEILTKVLNKKCITEAQFKYLSGPDEFNFRKFYLLPKIHKPKEKWPNPKMPEGRPIVSDTNSESSRVAEYIDHYINPLSTTNFSYIKNSFEFIKKVRNHNFSSNYLLVTGDVKSLYTNMNIPRMVEVVKNALENNPLDNRPDNELIELLEFTLLNNDFSFNGQQYLQTYGTAMGKKYAPALANLYLAYFDEQAVGGYEIHPELYFRFLDDVFFIWSAGLEKLKKFESFLNTLLPGIEITLEHSTTEIPFLDVLLYIKENKIQTRTYFKETDTHQLLHTKSYHPKHTCKGILKSQLIRFKRLSSTFEDYNSTCNILYSYIKDRGYKSSEYRKLKFSVWHATETQPMTGNNNKLALPIISNFSPLGKQLSLEYRKIISQNEQFNQFEVITAYKIAPNLKQILVRADTSLSHETSSKPKGLFLKCDSAKCKMCMNFSSNTNIIKSCSNNKAFPILGTIQCHSQNVIYVITCIKCKLQYVGETGRSLKDRFNDHMSTIMLHKNTAIGKHFNTSQHSRLDIKIVAIEKVTSNQASVRKTKEKEWISKLGTQYPWGLNNYPL